MALGPTVTLVFAGDDSRLSRTLDSVGDSTSGALKGLGLLGAAGAGAGAVAAAGIAGAALAIGGLGVMAAAQSEEVQGAFTALKDSVVADVQELATPFESVLIGIADQARSTFDQLAPALGQMFAATAPMVGELAGGLLSLVTNVFPGLQAAVGAAAPIVTVLADGLAGLGTGMSGFLSGISAGAPGAAAALGGIFTVVNGLLPVLGSLVGTLATALGPVVAALAPIIVSLAQTMGAILTPIIAALGPPVLAVVTALGAGLTPVLAVVGEAVTRLAPVLAGLAAQVGQVLVGAIQAVAPLLPVLVQSFFQIVDALLPVIPPLLEIAGELFPMLGDILATVVVPLIRNVVVPLIRDYLAPALIGLARAGADLAGAMRASWGFIRDTTTSAVAWVGGRLSDLTRWFRELPGSIRGAVGNLGATLYSAGRDVVTGLWNGITGAAGWLRDRIAGFFGSLVPGWAKDFLGIRSPSTVFADQVGRYIPEGVAVGIERNAGTVRAAVGEMTDGALGGMSSLSRLEGGGRQAQGGAAIQFVGNTDSAVATLIMALVRTGQIQLVGA